MATSPISAPHPMVADVHFKSFVAITGSGVTLHFTDDAGATIAQAVVTPAELRAFAHDALAVAVAADAADPIVQPIHKVAHLMRPRVDPAETIPYRISAGGQSWTVHRHRLPSGATQRPARGPILAIVGTLCVAGVAALMFGAGMFIG